MNRLLGTTAGWVVLIGAVAWGAPAFGQTKSQIVLVVAPGTRNIEPDRLRSAVAQELDADVVLGGAAKGDALSVAPRREDELVVTYTRGEHVLSRTVSVADRPDDAMEAVALLAGNMVRNEAAEVIDDLRARRRGTAHADEAQAEPASPPPAPEAAPPRQVARVVIPPAARPAAVRTKPDPAPRPDASVDPCHDPALRRFPIGGDFVPRLGSSAYERGGTVRLASINALVGSSGGLAGGEVGGLVNHETKFACGAQVAGIANVVAGPAVGAQFAGIANVVAGPGLGAQFAGIANVSSDLTGVQVGTADVARDLNGVQVGVVEVARDVRGAQVGVVNVSNGTVHGAQVGVVNVADDSDFSLGVVSIVRNGRTRIDAWVGDWLVAAGVKHGGRHFYNLYAFGAAPGFDTDEGGRTVRPVAMLGLGGHFDLSERILLDVDAVASTIIPTGGRASEANVATVRAVLGLRVFRQFAVWAGPTYNVGFGRSSDEIDGLQPMSAKMFRESSDFAIGGWPGAVLGVEGL